MFGIPVMESKFVPEGKAIVIGSRCRWCKRLAGPISIQRCMSQDNPNWPNGFCLVEFTVLDIGGKVEE